MPAVRVLPLDVTFEVTAGEAVMAAGARAGLWWPTVCHGQCECGTCWVVVTEGWEHCSPMGTAERSRLDLGMKAGEPRARLGCQLRVTGPVTLSRRSVRRPDPVPGSQNPGTQSRGERKDTVSANGTPSADVLLRMYRTVTRIQATDERLRNLLAQGKIFVFYYSPRGQEIIPAAVSACLRADDYVCTTYRGLHDEIAKGVPLREVLAEILGRSTGSCKGKGGPMHISDPHSGLMVTTGVVGSGLPIANGLALASKLSGDGRVTVVNFGDGAANIGAFHEALNLAAVWGLPVVFVCQNNRYGEFTPIGETQRVEHLSSRAAGYGIPGITVDGNDPDAMWAAAAGAIDRARRGEGPTLLECLTYRFMGHFFGDQMGYMDQEEYQAALAADPVPRLRARLVAEGHATEEALAALEAEAGAEADDAVEFAMASPPPEPADLFEDVYAQVVTR